jgi:hypothetical protein
VPLSGSAKSQSAGAMQAVNVQVPLRASHIGEGISRFHGEQTIVALNCLWTQVSSLLGCPAHSSNRS